jgi:hypothetical protein
MNLDLAYIRIVTGYSVVGLETPYGLDGPGIESRLMRDFRTCSERLWGQPGIL